MRIFYPSPRSHALLMTLICTFPSTVRAERCVQIQGTEESLPTDPQGQCPSPLGFCSPGRVDANHGLRGDVFFVATSTSPGPATAADAAGWATYAGPVTITTAAGTLSGISLLTFNNDLSSATGGQFSALDVYTEGTGRFAGARAQLVTAGTAADSRASPVRTALSGQLCFPE